MTDILERVRGSVGYFWVEAANKQFKQRFPLATKDKLTRLGWHGVAKKGPEHPYYEVLEFLANSKSANSSHLVAA